MGPEFLAVDRAAGWELDLTVLVEYEAVPTLLVVYETLKSDSPARPRSLWPMETSTLSPFESMPSVHVSQSSTDLWYGYNEKCEVQVRSIGAYCPALNVRYYKLYPQIHTCTTGPMGEGLVGNKLPRVPRI